MNKTQSISRELVLHNLIIACSVQNGADSKSSFFTFAFDNIKKLHKTWPALDKRMLFEKMGAQKRASVGHKRKPPSNGSPGHKQLRNPSQGGDLHQVR